MEGKSIIYYTESGIAPLINIFFCFVISCVVIVPISYFYSLLITYMPFIYLNLVIVILYGYTISLIVNTFSRFFKIRNKKKTIALTLLVGLVAIYEQWISYLYIITSEDVTLFFDIKTYFGMLLRPDYLFFEIIELNKFGAWELFSILFKGSTLWIIWVLEILMTLFASYFGIINTKNPPFSENDNNWYKKHTLDSDFEPIKLKNNFIEEYEKNPFIAICSLGKSDFTRYSKIYIYSSASETRNLISIENVLVTEKGSGKKEFNEILAPHYIDNNYMIQLKQNFRLKKSSFFDFFKDLYS
jgi:hypothetical protein